MKEAPKFRSGCGQCGRAASQATTRASWSVAVCLAANSRLAHEESRHDADACERRHDGVTRRPAVALRDPERAGAARDQRGPIAELIGGDHRALLVERRGLDAPGVDRDVLGRGAEGEEQRTERDLRDSARRLAAREVQQREADADLGKQHPAATLSEPGVQQRQLQAVYDRRPQEFQRVDEADPGKHADGRPFDALLPQPGRQGLEHQVERQACGEAEKEHRQYRPLPVDQERLLPAAPLLAQSS